ncbi:hypothetical protein MMC31_003734, partial [Peltigera leucophlebia]|nr:hypothetical protein [Peltigera leucophlebia]
MPEPKGPNPVVPNIESLRAIPKMRSRRRILWRRVKENTQENSGSSKKIKEEIAKLCASLTSFVSRRIEGRGSLGNTNGMEPKANFLCVRFPTIHKKHFKNMLYNRFKANNIMKLSPSFTTIKLAVKYIKVEDSTEL